MIIALEFIEKILEAVFWTGAIRDGIPLSVFLIARAGSGKSRTLVPFGGPSIFRADDMTSSGLLETLEHDKESKIKHILISDFNAVLSHKSSTTNLTIGNLLSLMSEGTVRIADGRRNKELLHKPVGLVVGITPEMYEQNFRKWNDTGFRRRFFPVFYDYGAATIAKIQKAIEDNKVRMVVGKTKHLHLPPKQMQPQWRENEKRALASATFRFCENLAFGPMQRFTQDRKVEIVSGMGPMPLPFTPEQMLQELAEACAIKDRSGNVRTKDVEFVQRIVDYTRYGNPVQL